MRGEFEVAFMEECVVPPDDIPVIAIDGPSASGKGTVAALVAQRLSFHRLDSGALYRLVALAAERANVALDDEGGLEGIAAQLPARFVGDEVFLGEDEVTTAIRSEPISAAASKVAAWPRVRQALVERQRAYRRAPGLVAEGRDMGTVIFPDAQLKVFLSASVEARAERRYKQLMEKDLAANMHGLLQDLRERDARDIARSVAPLQKSADAVPLDTTDMTIEQAVAAVLDLVRSRLPRLAAPANAPAKRN